VVNVIDKLCLRCDFKKEFEPSKGSFFPSFNLSDLGIPLEISIDKDGDQTNIRHPWELIPSSHAGLAFKVFDYRLTGLDGFYVEIKASPAKLMYGHNIFGSSCLKECSLFMVELLCNTYPVLFERLDMGTWRLCEIDVTYFSRADSDEQAIQFINSLQNVSYGQTKSNHGHNGTAYFGSPKSRLKRHKIYAKYQEVLKTIEENKLKKNSNGQKDKNFVYETDLLEWAKGMVRWEATLYHRWLERRGIDCDLSVLVKDDRFFPEGLMALWKDAHSDIFKSLEGLEMTAITDEKVHKLLREKFFKVSEKTGKISYVLADSAYETFEKIEFKGWDTTKKSMSNDKFYRHVKMLTECGLSRAYLQNLKGNGQANVIPFRRFIGVDFGEQLPNWVTERENGSLAFKPRLVV
jgi:II/X family phage/plasmid replication protein